MQEMLPSVRARAEKPSEARCGDFHADAHRSFLVTLCSLCSLCNLLFAAKTFVSCSLALFHISITAAVDVQGVFV